MSFLNPAILWGLLAVSLPVIIHLLNRRRHRTVQWAAMEFLLKATRESRGKKKLKYIIILTCRALAIAGLILALAQPIVGGLFGWGGSKLDTVILILDRSASMEMQSADGRTSKRQAALEKAAAAIAELNHPKLVLIESAGGEIIDVDSPEVLLELDAAKATDTAANIPELILRAIDYMMDVNTGRTEIWVASDLQANDWEPQASRWAAVRAGMQDLPATTRLRILGQPEVSSSNYSIKVTSTTRQDDALLLDIELTRSSELVATSIPITYSINGSRNSDKVTINGGSIRFQKRLPLGGQADGGHGFVAIPADTNPSDNVYYFAYGEDAPTRSWVVTESIGESADWLKIAAAPPGYGSQEVEVVTAARAHTISWEDAAMIIWQAQLPTGANADMLSSYLENGGQVLFFPPHGEDKGSFLGIQWANVVQAASGSYHIVSEWDRGDGPLRNGIEGGAVGVDKLRAIRYRRPVGDAAILAEWDKSKSPLLLRRIQGNGTAIFFTTLPDYKWSNLADGDVLLPLVQRLIEDGSQRFGSAFSATAGSNQMQLKPGEIRERLDTRTEGETISTQAAYHAGVWKLGDRTLAANRPAGENDWLMVEDSQLAQLLDGVDYLLFADQAGSSAQVEQAWRAFLFAMLMFMIAEALLCLQPRKSRPPAPPFVPSTESKPL